jgi:hypothetical protein
MPESKGGSGKSFWWSLLIIMTQILMVMVLVPTAWLEDVVRIEDEMLYATLGQETAYEVELKGYTAYDTVFVKTGITQHVKMLFIPTEEERARSRGMETLGQEGWFPWLESRGFALQLMLVQAFERLAHIYIWTPVMLMIFLPAAWDGYQNWQMKRTSLGYSSPFWHRLGIKMTGTSIMLMVMGTFLPFPLPPIILPALIMIVIPFLGSIVIANLPKRI